jgi:hypothetical protein
MEQPRLVCPGCGIQIYSDLEGLDRDFNASNSCRSLFYDLSYYTLSLRDSFFIHQLAVDAYAAQHSGERVKPIATTFALVGLFLVNERNYTGKQVQNAHMALAKKSKVWPNFSAPQDKAWLTVWDVTQSPNEERQGMIKKWNQSAWALWLPEKENVAALLKRYLDL